MQAILLERPAPIEERPLRAVTLPDPVPGPGELLLEVSVCGACRTDLHTVEGDITPPAFPIVPGHQVVGRVRSAGPGAGRFSPGDRVGAAWIHDACGECPRCLSGRENLCEGARFHGFHVNGGYAELMLARADYAFPLPEGFPDVHAAPLLCAGIIGYRALRLSRAAPGQVLGLYGFGGSAHVTIQVARHLGMEVFVFSRSAEHRELARELGAAWTGRAEEDPPRKLDAAVCFAPAGPLVPEILRVMDRGATLALAGVTMTPIPEIDYDRLLYQERAVTSVANFTRKDAEELLRYAGEIPLRTEIETHPLAAANDVLLRMKRSLINGTAVLEI